MKAHLLILALASVIGTSGCSRDDQPSDRHGDPDESTEGKAYAITPIDFQKRMASIGPGSTKTQPFLPERDTIVYETKQADLTIPPGTFREQLLYFAAEYEKYGLADRQFAWSPIDCLAGGAQVHLSHSRDNETHGQKVYLVFARRIWPSEHMFRGSTYSRSPTNSAPVGQVVVKESWHPEPVPVDKLPPPHRRPGGPNAKTWYQPGKKGDLFIMYKLDPSTPDTDEGWIYGAVTPDGKEVISAGRVESCMRCHKNAPYDRLFGLPEESETEKKRP